MAEKKRLGSIDLAKAVAFALVVCGHTFPVGGRFRAIIYSFHMPLYFVLAGYTFSKKPLGTTIRSSAKRLLLPYALFYFTASCIPSVLIWTESGRLAKLKELFLRFIFVAGNGHGIDDTGAIWTLVALFLSRVILTVLFNLFEKRNLGLHAQGAICTSVALAGYGIAAGLGIRLPMCFDIGMVGTLFMWSGYALRKTGLIEKRFNPALLLIPLAIWILEIRTGLPEWTQAVSMLGQEYLVLPLAWTGAICASFLLIKACQAVETAFEGWEATSLPRRVLSFGEYLGKSGLKLYLIHCLDFNFAWTSINIALLGSTALTASIARFAFDILILVLFSLL